MEATGVYHEDAAYYLSDLGYKLSIKIYRSIEFIKEADDSPVVLLLLISC
jgi:predicted solute-binding protein